MMKFAILLCLAATALANKLAAQDLAKAKQALDELTFSKEEHIYNVEGYVEGKRGYNDVMDPCSTFTCRIGWMCVVDPVDQTPFCDCATSCPGMDSPGDSVLRSKVCSTTNNTYANLCDFHRQKCLDDALAQVSVDYYGECSEIGVCTEEDLLEYPERMVSFFSDALQHVFGLPEELGGLSEKEKAILEEPRNPIAQVIYWQFRRLDNNPADLYLDFAEMEDLRAPIVLMEPCTKPFLRNCDADQDDLISVLEFSACLKLDPKYYEY